MYNLVNYSFVILALAIFGYATKDIFNYYRKFSTPYDIKKPTEVFFSLISFAITVISFSWIIFGFFLVLIYNTSPDSLDSLFQSTIGPFSVSFENLRETNLVSEEEYVSIVTSLISGLYFLTMFSKFYIYYFGFISTLGIFFSFIETSAICVYFEDGTKHSYRRIIHESSDFIYVQKLKNFRDWIAIPKSKIIQIENTVVNPEYRSKMSILSEKYHNNPKKFKTFIISTALYFIGTAALFYSIEIYGSGNIWYTLGIFIPALLGLTLSILLLLKIRNET